MAYGYFLAGPRWLLIALLVALAVAVVSRQLTDLGGAGTIGQRPATAVRGPFMNRDLWHAAYACSSAAGASRTSRPGSRACTPTPAASSRSTRPSSWRYTATVTGAPTAA